MKSIRTQLVVISISCLLVAIWLLTIGPMSSVGRTLLYKSTGIELQSDYTTEMTDDQLRAHLSQAEYEAHLKNKQARLDAARQRQDVLDKKFKD